MDDEVRLRTTLAILAVTLATLPFAGREYEFWPVANWPVYDDYVLPVPPPTVSVLEARVTTRDGATRRFLRDDLVEMTRESIAALALERSVHHRDDRVYLAYLGRRAAHAPVERVEVWRITYDVDTSEVPALDIDHPVAERRLVAFRPDGTKLPS